MFNYVICFLLIISTCIAKNAYANCRGCCSHHKGVVCVKGVTLCGDGTPLSAICTAKGCSKCVTSKKSLKTKKNSKKSKLKVSTSKLDKKTDIYFLSAKKILTKIYSEQPVTFYCECKYSPKTNEVNHKSCGYDGKVYKKRSKKIEWEHIVPAHRFGGHLNSWKNAKQICGKSGGRKCAAKMNKRFALMEGDLHNLVPSVGSLNAIRSNLAYGEIKGEKREFGKCDFEKIGKIVEPRPQVRGDIARTYLYMEQRYGINLTQEEIKMYQVWHKADPPSEWEKKKNRLIYEISGVYNLFITIN